MKRKPIKPINVDQLKNVLILDTESPSGLRWKSTYGSFRGKPAGHLNELGYWTVRINRSLFYAHRIVRALTIGNDPGNVEVRR